LAFDLPARDEMTRAAFFVSPVERAGAGGGGRLARLAGGKMLLVGPSGSGKTHLAHLWAPRPGRR
jgi:chromosomal replication initiation ATPase DnaA